MTVELAKIADFLSRTHPFSDLTDGGRATIPPLLTIHYARRGTEIIRAGAGNSSCFIIRSDMVGIFDPAGTLLDGRNMDNHFSYLTLLNSDPSLYIMTAVKDCVFLVISREVFDQLNDQFVEVRRYYGDENARIRAVASKLRSTAALESLRIRVADLMETPLVACSADMTVQGAAQIMTERNVSSLFVMESAGANQSPLVGIITNHDFRRRVLAEAKPTESFVSEVMTENPETISPDLLVFEAMLLMAECGYRHLPAHDGTRVIGMIVIGDLLHSLHTDPIYITATLARKSDISKVAEVAQDAWRIVDRFIDRGNLGEEVARLLTAMVDAITRRLVALAEEELGPPPVSYASAVLGSHGCREMGLASDQDNTLILVGDYDTDSHSDFFAALSGEICTNLDRVGYPLCPGSMMAGNPARRVTKSQWLRAFHRWVTAPETEALLRAQAFFDTRGVADDVRLVEGLRTAYLPLAQGSQRPHAHLTKLAVWREPPLGFSRDLALEKGGEHTGTLGIKKGGTAAMVQVAHLFTIAASLPQLSTHERLAASTGARSVSRQGAQDLASAFGSLCTMQLDHQQARFNAGEQPNNHIYPKHLSSLEGGRLRGAFGITRELQQSLGAKYPIRAMSQFSCAS